MKYFVASACILAVLLPGGSAPAATKPAAKAANYDAFGLALLRRLAAAQPSENVFISPVSIGTALAMASDGAAGATRSALLKTLGLPGSGASSANAALIASLRANGDAKIGLANAIWFRADLPPKPAFVKMLQSDYGATAQAVDFASPSAAATINDWAKSQTLGLIDQLVGQTSEADFAYLTNAIVFQGKWSAPFEARETEPRPFTNGDGKVVTVSMMSQTNAFLTGRPAGYDLVRMPYGAGGFAAYILLPKAKNTASLLQNVTASWFDHELAAMHSEHIALSLPRFTASYRIGLVPALRAMGAGVAFGADADFSPMHAPPPRLFISSVDHAAVLRVDEEGTTAAAATAVGMSEMAIHVQRQPRAVVVDHPFVIVLRDERTGSLLFSGVIRTLAPDAP
jgi:serine protease inhibitor